MDEINSNEFNEENSLYRFIMYAMDTYYDAMQSCRDLMYQTLGR